MKTLFMAAVVMVMSFSVANVCHADINKLSGEITRLAKHIEFINKHFHGKLSEEEAATRKKIDHYQLELDEEKKRLDAGNQAAIEALEKKLAKIRDLFGEQLPGEEASLQRQIDARRGGVVA